MLEGECWDCKDRMVLTLHSELMAWVCEKCQDEHQGTQSVEEQK